MSFSSLLKRAGEAFTAATDVAAKVVKDADLGTKLGKAGDRLDAATDQAKAAVLTEAIKGAQGDGSLKAQAALVAVKGAVAVGEGVDVAKEKLGEARKAVSDFLGGSQQGPKPQP